jgi:hypothetical protein
VATGEGASFGMVERDWLEWHRVYDDPSSPFVWRLHTVQSQISKTCSERPPGPIRVISMCAGQGHDLIGALSRHPRRDDVTALLVERDERNVALARRAAAQAGLNDWAVVTGDASNSSSYAGAVPCDLILTCGMLGNIDPNGLPALIDELSRLSAEGATVIWTYNRLDPKKARALREMFDAAGYQELAYEESSMGPEVVGVNRLAGTPGEFRNDVTMFQFVGYDNLGYMLPDYTR